MVRDDLKLHTILKHDPPADYRGTQAECKKAQSRLPEDHSRDAEGEADDDVARESGYQVAKDDAGVSGPDEAGGNGVIFFSQRK